MFVSKVLEFLIIHLFYFQGIKCSLDRCETLHENITHLNLSPKCLATALRYTEHGPTVVTLLHVECEWDREKKESLNLQINVLR